MIPTGSRDPFALRRAAQGVVRILIEGRLDLPLLDFLGGDEALKAFFAERVRYYFKDIRGFAYDEINACMAASCGWGNLVDLEARLERVRALRASPDFEPVAAAFKRIANILAQAKFTFTSWVPNLLEAGPEKDLYDEFVRNAGRPIETTISVLRPKIDLFFDKVLVNAPDPFIRQNRLSLLYTLRQEFSRIADFSEIVTNS